MIKNFQHKGLEKFFYDGNKKGIITSHASKLSTILDHLNFSKNIQDMNFPGSYLHPLLGNRKGFWAVKVSGNWRITFRFQKDNAYDVDYEDYH